MADRVHPHKSPPAGDSSTTSSHNPPEIPAKLDAPASEKPIPPPGTYVIQIPKDQVYRYPPPENARKYQSLTRLKTHRSHCCRCFCYTVGLVFILLVLAAVTAGVLYLVFRPELPKYSVDEIAISGFNLTSSALSSSKISPAIDVTIRSQNPNDKISIYYEKGSSVNVHHSDINLCHGVLPTFYQPSNNVTVFKTALKGSGIVLTSAIRRALEAEQRQGKVPLQIDLKAPVRIKFGSVKTWVITVKISCDITVNALTTNSKIVSKDCDVDVKPW